MNNPLNSFKRNMIDFEIYRNSNLMSIAKGLKNTEKGSNKKYIGFFPEADVQIGDVLIIPNTNIKYFIVDVDTSTYMGEVFQLKAYYQTTNKESTQATSIVFNVTDSPNSIIGTQMSAIINNPTFGITDFNKLIDTYGGDDKKELYVLSSQLKELINQDNFHKSKLSKFSDLIAKHSWLPLAIAQLLSAYLQSH